MHKSCVLCFKTTTHSWYNLGNNYPVCHNCYLKSYRDTDEYREKNRIYMKKYYKENKPRIKITRKANDDKAYRELEGHAELVFRAVHRYAKQHKIAIISKNKFISFSTSDPDYERLYKNWVEDGFSPRSSPMITRIVYPGDYITMNMKWVTKDDCGLGDLKIQQEILEQRETLIEDIVDVIGEDGYETRSQVRAWLSRMPALYKPSSLNETMKRVEALIKRRKYKYDPNQ